MDGYMVRRWAPGEELEERHWRYFADCEDAKKAIREAVAKGLFVNVQVCVTTFDNAIVADPRVPFTVGDEVRTWLATMVDDYNEKYRRHHAVAVKEEGSSTVVSGDRSHGGNQEPPRCLPEQAPDREEELALL